MSPLAPLTPTMTSGSSFSRPAALPLPVSTLTRQAYQARLFTPWVDVYRGGRILASMSAERPRQHELRLAAGQPRLTRSRDGRWVTGLCSGIAEFTGSRVTVVRTIFVVATVASLFTVALGYLLISMLVPAATESPAR